MRPGAPFCHPSCFAQQPGLSARCPRARPQNMTRRVGCHSFLVYTKPGGVRGDTRCCRAGGMQEVACGLQSLPEAQPAGLWLSQQLHVGKNQQRGRRKGDGRRGGRDLQVTTADIGEPCTFFQACLHLSSNHVPIATLGGRPTR